MQKAMSFLLLLYLLFIEGISNDRPNDQQKVVVIISNVHTFLRKFVWIMSLALMLFLMVFYLVKDDKVVAEKGIYEQGKPKEFFDNPQKILEHQASLIMSKKKEDSGYDVCVQM